MKQTFHHIFRFIRDNNYQVTFDEFTKQLTSHPDYPSLYAISDSLHYWKIENVVVRVPKEELHQLPESFIAVTGEDGDQNIVYARKSGDKIRIYEEKNKEEIGVDEFLELWSGIILAVEPNEIKGSRFRLSVSGLSYVFLFTALFAVILRLMTGNYTLPAIAFLLISGMGVFISILAIRETLGFFSGTVHKICNAGNKTSCEEVLSSRAAKILGSVTLSDLCLIYFVSFVLTSLAVPESFTSVWTFFIVLGGVLFSLYSIYYQAVVIKKWCMLCLGISLLLYVQLGVLLLSSYYTFDVASLSFLILTLALTALGWIWSKEKLVKLRELENVEVEFLKFKRNRKVFRAVLEDGDKVDQASLESLEVLKLGEENTGEVIYGILSPSCIHCKSAFLNYLDLIRESPKGLECAVLFNVNPENDKNPYLDICYRVLEMYEKNERQKVLIALNEWYMSGFDLKEWQDKYGKVSNEDVYKYRQQVYRHYHWCKENKINYTPATVFHGCIYPADFAIKDLKFFLEGDH
ncbi:vitamin K epoxide reductase family protein [Sinomicrobium sp. M5D2P9]